ncbi:MAG: hypothetical protein K0Q74_1148 [Gammaproteobacteria bacterium]|nr:hypothetical protein [Gammaproteobacteria bacterium]
MVVVDKENYEELSRLKWQCRRGVLELDMLLIPFLSEAYPKLSEKEKATFVALLASSDETLLSWFFGDARPDTEDLHQMVLKVLSNRSSSI